MRALTIALACLPLLAACGPTYTPEQQAQRAANLAKNDAIWAARRGYSVGGIHYEVGVAPDRSYALVAPVGQESFTLRQVEMAARAATGCRATGDSFMMMLVGSKDAPLPIRALKGVHGRTRVELQCG